jgi:hypothetical protein
MATLDDMLAGLTTAAAGVLFPGQAFQFGATADVVAPWQGQTGAAALTLPAKLAIGAPTVAEENALLAASTAGVFLMCVPGMNRNTTRFAPYYSTVSVNTPTLLVAMTTGTVTFGGACAANQVVGIIANNVCYAYRTTAMDTPATVAAAFAAQINGALAAGAVLTAANVTAANVVCDQQGLLHTGTQQQMVQIAVLAPNMAGTTGALARAAIVRALGGLKSLQRDDGSLTRFIGLPDGSSAEVRFHHEESDDTPRNQNIWRQWLYFLCEYDETIPVLQPTVLTVNVLMQTGADALMWIGPAPNVQNVLTDGQGNILGDAAGNMLGSFS